MSSTTHSNTDIARVLSKLSPYTLSQIKLLNEEQLSALYSIALWVNSSSFGGEQARIISGFAGTGKSFLVKVLALVLPNAVLCAPTNKAVKVLAALGTGLECCTIYSLLGLKMEQHEDTIRLTKSSSNRAQKYNYVVLDECGMTGKELYAYIQLSLNSGIRFVFIGDIKQLPPIGEIQSEVWGKFKTDVLTRVMRHDNQILTLATHVRNTDIYDIKLSTDNTKTQGVWYLNNKDFEEKIKKYAKLGAFTNHSKAIAWRNKTVDRLNSIIRSTIHSGNTDILKNKFLPTDKIVFTSPYSIKNGISIFTDDEATVNSVILGKHALYDLSCYHLSLQLDNGYCVIQVIHESSEKELAKMLSSIALEARKPGKGKLWQDFWKLSNSFCSVKHAYALTVHRSQGSTYSAVFVDVNDILVNSNQDEAKKCLYVAVTRPSKKLFLV